MKPGDKVLFRTLATVSSDAQPSWITKEGTVTKIFKASEKAARARDCAVGDTLVEIDCGPYVKILLATEVFPIGGRKPCS